MHRARDIKTGKLISLEELWRAHADEISLLQGHPGAEAKIAALLNEKICCPECGMPVYAYAKNIVGGFKLAGVKIGDARGRSLTEAKFQHYPDNPGYNEQGLVKTVPCSLYLPLDPRFNNLRPRKNAPEIKEMVGKVLCDPAVKAMNQNILNRLFFAAAGRSVTAEDVKGFDRIAKEFSAAEVLIKHPWLLPFIVLVQKGKVHGAAEGQIRTVRKETFLSYVSQRKTKDGETIFEDRLAKIPSEMFIVGGVKNENGKKYKKRFYLDEKEACLLGGVEAIPVVSLDASGGTLAAPVAAGKDEAGIQAFVQRPLQRVVRAGLLYLPGFFGKACAPARS